MPDLKENETGLFDLASSNNNLKEKISYIISNIDSINQEELDKQIIEMLENMMNFFASYVEEIPNFNSLSPAHQQILISKFKSVSAKLKNKNIRSVDQMVQTAVFVVLNALSNNIANLKELTAEEILRKKHKNDFRKFLKNATEYEIIQATREKQNIGKNNFITEAVIHGVEEALKNLNIDFNFKEADKESLQILQEAHQSFKKNKFHSL